MERERLLVVEDEESHQLILKKALHRSYELVFASTFKEAKVKLRESHFDLILLDIVLDEADGFALCSEIKANPQTRWTPIIFLSGRSEVSTKVLGFTLGADDYIVKPVDPMELRARVQAKLRSAAQSQVKDSQLEAGPFVLDVNYHLLRFADASGEPIELTPIEFKLMVYFLKHPETPLKREDILNTVWGGGTHVLERTVDTFVATLRRKLGPYSGHLQSVHKIGYRLATKMESPKKVG